MNVSGVVNALVEGNRLYRLDGDDPVKDNWIATKPGTNIVVRNNIAPRFMLDPTTTASNNVVDLTQPTTEAYAKVISDWDAKYRTATNDNPPTPAPTPAPPAANDNAKMLERAHISGGIDRKVNMVVGAKLRIKSTPQAELLGAIAGWTPEFIKTWRKEFSRQCEVFFHDWAYSKRVVQDAERHYNFGGLMWLAYRGVAGPDAAKLGHQSVRFTQDMETGAASNQNQASGQDGYDILSGRRTIELDLNNMAVADFDFDARVDNQTVIPILSTWGAGAGNNMGLMLPNNVLDPGSPGERNGYVNLTGNAYTVDVDKSAAFAIWW